MTEPDLITLLRPHLDAKPEGIFTFGEFDLDLNRAGGFALWLDSNEKVVIPLDVNRDNAVLIQRVVRALGREVLHTWSEQYSTEP